MSAEISSYVFAIYGVPAGLVVDREAATGPGRFAAVTETNDGAGLLFDCGIPETLDFDSALERAIRLWPVLCRLVPDIETIPDKTLRMLTHVSSQGWLYLTCAQMRDIAQCGFDIGFSLYASDDED